MSGGPDRLSLLQLRSCPSGPHRGSNERPGLWLGPGSLQAERHSQTGRAMERVRTCGRRVAATAGRFTPTIFAGVSSGHSSQSHCSLVRYLSLWLPRDIRLAGFGSRRDCDSAPHSSPHSLGWRNGASMETLSCVRVDHRVKLKIVKAYAIPSQKYRKRRLPDCPDRETQSSAFAFPALSRASGLHELSGRSSICAIPSNL